MKRKGRFNRSNQEKIKLDIYNWNGSVIHRAKATINEKHKGVLMMDRVKDFFNIGPEEEQRIRTEHIEREVAEMTPKPVVKPIWSDLARDRERAARAKELREQAS